MAGNQVWTGWCCLSRPTIIKSARKPITKMLHVWNIWAILGVNAGTYSIHGASGSWNKNNLSMYEGATSTWERDLAKMISPWKWPTICWPIATICYPNDSAHTHEFMVKLLNYLVSRYSDFRYLDSIDPFFLVKHEQTKLTLSFAKSSRVPDIDLLKSHRGHLFGWGTLGMEYPQSFGVGLFFSKHVCPEVSLHL